MRRKRSEPQESEAKAGHEPTRRFMKHLAPFLRLAVKLCEAREKV